MRTLALAVVLGSVAFAGLAAPSMVQEDPSLVGLEAPALTTKDFLQSSGRTSVADYKGEVLLVERFATWCGPCVGQMPHISKLTEEYGKKGFHAIAVTNEPRDIVLKFMTQLNVSEITYTMGVGGGAEAFPARGIPKAFLINVEGKVVWEGFPGDLSNKMIEEELKKVKLTDDMKLAAAQKSVQYAESLIAAKEVLRASNVLASISKNYKGSAAAKQAAERITALEKDPALAKELAAQRSLDGMVGGLDMPKEKLKSKERTAKANQLTAFAQRVKGDAPYTSELATAWVKVMNEDWVVER